MSDDEFDDDEDIRHQRTDAGTGLTRSDSRVVTHWPCASRSGCKNIVEVTSAGVAAFEAANRMLAARGEHPLVMHEVIPCDACGLIWHRRQAEASEKRREQISKFVEELRDPSTPPQRIAVAEDYLLKRANDGRSLVALLAARRRGGGSDENKPSRKGRW